jgi:hypothetical protein
MSATPDVALRPNRLLPRKIELQRVERFSDEGPTLDLWPMPHEAETDVKKEDEEPKHEEVAQEVD